MSDFVISGDYHLKTTDKYGKILPDGRNSRLVDKLDQIQKSVDYTLEHKIPYWICDGDVFDKINPPEFLRKAFFEIIKPLIVAGVKIYFIIGNHDTDYRVHTFMADAELLAMFKSDAIIIVTEPMEITLGDVELLLIPFDKSENISQVIEKQGKGKIVVGHFGIEGAVVSTTEYVMDGGVKQKILDIPRYTYAGHFHTPQKTSKWMYIGSIAKADYGERNDKKGFVHVTATATKIEHKFIDVKDRVFIYHEVIESEDPEFKKLVDLEGTVKGQVVKLIFIGEETWYLRFNLSEIRSKILKTGDAHKLFIEHKTFYESRIRVPEINASSSWDEGIEMYCKKEKAPNMVDIGKSILKEVL